MMSFTMQISFSLLSLNSQQLSAHIVPRSTYSLSCCPPKGNRQPLAFHFSSAFHSTYLAMRPHPPPWRMHREYRNSVSQVSKLADPRRSCISASKAAVRCPWIPVRVRIFDTTDGLATSKAVFTSKLAIKAVLYRKCTGCRSTRLSSCLQGQREERTINLVSNDASDDGKNTPEKCSKPTHVGASELAHQKATVRDGRGLSAGSEPRLGDREHKNQRAPAEPSTACYTKCVSPAFVPRPERGLLPVIWISFFLSARSFFLRLLRVGAQTVCSAFSCRGRGGCLDEDFSLVNGLTSLASCQDRTGTFSNHSKVGCAAERPSRPFAMT